MKQISELCTKWHMDSGLAIWNMQLFYLSILCSKKIAKIFIDICSSVGYLRGVIFK